MSRVNIPLVDSLGNDITLEGYLTIPNDKHTNSIVIFVHGSGSSKDSTRNQYLAKELNKNGITTFLFDLLTKEEQESDEKVEKILKEVPGLILNKFNISLLSDRLIKATNYILQQIPQLKEKELRVGYFGASTGSAAAIIAAASSSLNPKKVIKTIVSRGGRPDLVLSIPSQNNLLVENIKNIPLLFIIGEKDKLVLDLTSKFIKKCNMQKKFKIQMVKNATHLFEEEGALEKVGEIAIKWFIQHLQK